jgi:hypothetical protein
MSEADEVLATLDQLQRQFEGLAVRGLRAVGVRQTTALKNQADGLRQLGADHLAGQIEALLSAVDCNDRSAAALLMRAQASVRVFERILTLEAARAGLALVQQAGEAAEEDE